MLPDRVLLLACVAGSSVRAAPAAARVKESTSGMLATSDCVHGCSLSQAFVLVAEL